MQESNNLIDAPITNNDIEIIGERDESTNKLTPEEITKLQRIEQIRQHNLKYKPKKEYSSKYKKERARKNKQARKSNQINRRK